MVADTDGARDTRESRPLLCEVANLAAPLGPLDVYWGGGGGGDSDGTQTHCHGWRTPSP